MTRYVLGFAFDNAGENVVLIKKTKPEWQADKYNGVGGKIEPNEMPGAAMVREFWEEAGVMTQSYNWKLFGLMEGPDWDCQLYYTFNGFVFRNAHTTGEEEICTFSVQSLPETISNVPWLIAAARNHHENDGEFTLEAKYV